jgi:hypothetical protein
MIPMSVFSQAQGFYDFKVKTLEGNAPSLQVADLQR